MNDEVEVFSVLFKIEKPETYVSCIGEFLYTDLKKVQQAHFADRIDQVARHREALRVAREREKYAIQLNYTGEEMLRRILALPSIDDVLPPYVKDIYWIRVPREELSNAFGPVTDNERDYIRASKSFRGWRLLTRDDITMLSMERALEGDTYVDPARALHEKKNLERLHGLARDARRVLEEKNKK